MDSDRFRDKKGYDSLRDCRYKVMDLTEKKQLEKQYGKETIRRMEKRKKMQTLITFISVIFLGGSTFLALGKVFSDALKPASPSSSAQTTQKTPSLASLEQSYQLVLQREPNNQTALEGLLQTRLEMNNLAGAIAPLEKLVKLYPERSDYRDLLVKIKADLSRQK